MSLGKLNTKNRKQKEVNDMNKVIHSGRIDFGKFAGKKWEIIKQSFGARYRLEIAGEFWTSSDSQIELLDEIIALGG